MCAGLLSGVLAAVPLAARTVDNTAKEGKSEVIIAAAYQVDIVAVEIQISQVADTTIVAEVNTEVGQNQVTITTNTVAALKEGGLALRSAAELASGAVVISNNAGTSAANYLGTSATTMSNKVTTTMTNGTARDNKEVSWMEIA